MRATQRYTSPAQRILPVDERRFEFIKPSTSAADGSEMTEIPMTFYLTRSMLASLKREADAASASDWRSYAQRQLDDAGRNLRCHSRLNRQMDCATSLIPSAWSRKTFC